jgi:hypothetical protein
MTITTTASETYEQRLDNAVEVANELEPGTATASVSPASVPKLFWASVSLFAVNVLVLRRHRALSGTSRYGLRRRQARIHIG